MGLKCNLIFFGLGLWDAGAHAASYPSGFKLRVQSDLCLAMPSDSTAFNRGAGLRLEKCSAKTNQKFLLSKLPDGHVQVATQGTVKMCLGYGVDGLTKEGIWIQQSPCDPAVSTQKWRIAVNQNNTYVLLTNNAKNAASVESGSSREGARLVTRAWSSKSVNEQQFIFTMGSVPVALGINPPNATKGVCGSAANVPAKSAPTAKLCVTNGPNSTPSGAGPWSWNCGGVYGGQGVSCFAPLQTSTGLVRSIREWAKCDGSSDDRNGAAAAFAAARNNRFTLQIDCPVRMSFGADIAKPIFIESGVKVNFTNSGKFIVDNSGIPAFVLANARDIEFRNGVIEYRGSLGTDPSAMNPSGKFNDVTLKKWLQENRGINYVNNTPIWVGPPDYMAIFMLKGDTSRVIFDGMKIFVSSSAGAERFIPMCFSTTYGERDNQSVSRNDPINGRKFAVPSHITFRNIDLDGTIFGWQGTLQHSTFSDIRSYRYSDLQDAKGNNVGGVKKWFAPPHLFYLNYHPDYGQELYNREVHIRRVTDHGQRVGRARDKGGSDTISGYANSLKFGGENISVDQYVSYRPDGFMDVLASKNFAISNVKATYNSKFLNDLFPALRWPSQPYENVTFTNVEISDTTPSSIMAPMMGNPNPGNLSLQFTNVKFNLKKWVGSYKLDYRSATPGSKIYFGGRGHRLDIQVDTD